MSQHNYTRKPELKPEALHFLLNFMLGLPVIIGKRTIAAPEIPLLVVKFWKAKTRKKAEAWIEQEMRHIGMLKFNPSLAGRPPKPPQELLHWIPGNRRAA